MRCRDPDSYALTAGADSAEALNRGLLDLLRLRSGALESMASALVLDPGPPGVPPRPTPAGPLHLGHAVGPGRLRIRRR